MHCPASGRIYCPVGYIDREDSRGNVIPSDWRGRGNYSSISPVKLEVNMYSKSASEVRETLMKLLETQELVSVPWQKEPHYINLT